MIVLRCTAKLLKRLRQPAKPPEPPEAANPLGEWYADVDFIDREPFVILLNSTTGAGLVLPARAPDLRELNLNAAQQLFKLFIHYGFDLEAPKVGAELRAWDAPLTFGKTRDRSLLGSMNRFKDEAWHHFAHFNRSLPEAASRQWEGFFRHPSFAQPGRRYGFDAWQRPIDLVRFRLAGQGGAQAANDPVH